VKVGQLPHIIIKLASGRSEEQKLRIAAEVTKVIMLNAGCDENAVSIGIEDIELQNWTEQVFKPDILSKASTIYKKPGYDPT